MKIYLYTTPSGSHVVNENFLNYRGAWVSSTTYAIGDAVDALAGGRYYCLVANTNVTPGTNSAIWAFLTVIGEFSPIPGSDSFAPPVPTDSDDALGRVADTLRTGLGELIPNSAPASDRTFIVHFPDVDALTGSATALSAIPTVGRSLGQVVTARIGTVFYMWQVITSAGPSDSPRLIVPDDNATSGMCFQMLASFVNGVGRAFNPDQGYQEVIPFGGPGVEQIGVGPASPT